VCACVRGSADNWQVRAEGVDSGLHRQRSIVEVAWSEHVPRLHPGIEEILQAARALPPSAYGVQIPDKFASVSCNCASYALTGIGAEHSSYGYRYALLSQCRFYQLKCLWLLKWSNQ
jgi:hypothetical protein